MFLGSDHPGLDSNSQIEKFQEKALMELQDYVQKTYPDDAYRWVLIYRRPNTTAPQLLF